MTMAGEIVRQAFRESNMIGELDYPTPTQAREALTQLNSIFQTTFGTDAGERLEDWPLGTFNRDQPGLPAPSPWLISPPINMRLLATNTAALTVYLTPQPQDGSRMGIIDPFSRLAAVPVTLDGNGRPIEGTPTIVLNVNGTIREWFYRADLGAWVKLTGVKAGEEMPFPAEYDVLFAILLALRINPRFGQQIDEQSLSAAKSLKTEFVARYLQSRPLETDDSISWPFMSRQGYGQGGFSSTVAFNRGSYRGG